MPLRSITALVALSAVLAGSATAQQAGGFSYGLMGYASDSAYVGDGSGPRVWPLLRYESPTFSIGTDGLRLTLRDRAPVRIEGVMSPRFTGLSDPDAPELAGIDRDITADVGVTLRYSLGTGTALTATVLQEVTGQHDGQEVRLGGQARLGAGPVPLTFGAGVSWKSEELTNYLYGVGADETASGRPAYTPGDSLTPYISISGGMPVGQNMAVIGGMRADFLDDAATDSPIVEGDVAVSGRVGVVFQF